MMFELGKGRWVTFGEGRTTQKEPGSDLGANSVSSFNPASKLNDLQPNCQTLKAKVNIVDLSESLLDRVIKGLGFLNCNSSKK